MLNGNVQNVQFRRTSRNVNQVHRSSALEMSPSGTPNRQRIALRIVKENRFTQRRSYVSVATFGFALLQCSRDEVHAGLCFASLGRSALTFLWPFDWKNMVLDKAYGHRLLVISGNQALAGTLTQVLWHRNNVLADQYAD